MKTLGKLLGNAGRSIAMIGLGALLISNDDAACTPEEKMILGEMIAEEAAKEGDKFGEYTGKRLYLEGERERAEKIARAGADRTNVNVYVGENETSGGSRGNIAENVIYSDGIYNPAPGYTWLNNTTGDLRVRKIEEIPRGIDEYDKKQRIVGTWISPPPSFTCTDNEDINGDGYIGKDELMNLGSYFEVKNYNQRKRIICGSTWYFVKDKIITGKVKEKETGKIIEVDSDGPVNESVIRWIYLDFNKSKEDEGIKEYNLEWYIDGRLMPKRTINFFVDYGEKVSAEELREYEENRKRVEEEFMFEPEFFLEEDFFIIEDSTMQKP